MENQEEAQNEYEELSDEIADFVLEKLEEVQKNKRFKHLNEIDFMHGLISTIGMTLSYHMKDEEIVDFITSAALEGAKEQKEFESQTDERQ